MKRIKPTTGKIFSILLSICMFVTMFTCLTALPVSAAGTTPDLVEYKGVNYTCMKYTKGWSTIAAGNYRFQMDCKITSGTPLVQVGNDEIGTTISGYQTNRVGTYDSVNYKYTFTFTMTSSWSGNLGVQVGNNADYGGSGDAVFACANPTLYLLDGDGNPTGSNLINTFASDYYSTSRAGNKWNRRNFTSSTATCTSPVPDGYFDPLVPDYVHFEPNRNNYSRFIYLFKAGGVKAGDYRFQMDCKIFSGTPRISIGDRSSNTYPQFATQTNYTATYDPVNYKYTITFTLTADLGGSDYMGILVGNYGDDGDYVCANPTFYKMSGGDPTGSNLIETFASVNYSTSIAVGKWYRAGNYTCTAGIPEHYFDPESTNNYALHFIQSTDSYQVVVYKDTGIYVAANSVYRLVMDVNNLTEVEPVVEMRTGSSISTAYTGTLISTDGYERVYEFTVTSAATGIGLFMGPYDKGASIDVAFRKPRLYKWVNGAYGGANMVAPINSNNFDRHDWTGTRANAENGKWTPVNCNGTKLEYGADDGENFPGAPVDQMIHFPSRVADNYQVLCYKGGAISAGVYRFTVDECAVGGIKSDVLINVNSGTATSGYNGSMDIESGTEDILSGNKRTIYFRLWGNKTSFIVMIGNRNKGMAMDTYYKNPELVKIEGGNPTGDNLIENFTANNIVLQTATTKDSIETGKWTSINWANGYITYGDIDNDKFNPVYRDGDYTDNGTTDIFDLVDYKNVRCGNKVTLQSLDCDENGKVENADFKELINTILGRNVYTLKNTRSKLVAGDTVNVAYIGGSVTGGTGSTDASQYSWRARTTAWLQSKYPNATVNEINMGIGGTGSYLGAARFENNIVSRNPDLVFVEFAVNDGYNSISTEQTKQDIEYMIRSLNDNHPYCDMVFVMVTDRYKLGTQFTKLLEIKEVADYYGIPIIDVGVAMNETLGGSTANWDTYYGDMVHPNDDGYEVYANAVTSELSKLLVSGDYSVHRLKNVKYSLYTPDAVSVLTRDSFDLFKWGKLDSDWGAKYWFDNTDYEISGTPFRTSYSSCLSEIFSKYIYPLSDGADLTFTVQGTSIGILGNIKADQTLTVNIDGTDYVLSGSDTTNITEYPIANELADINHTVTITANGSGPYVAIAAVAVGS